MPPTASMVVVIRAWRQSGRLVIRLMASAPGGEMKTHRVVTDIEQACRVLSDLLQALEEPSSQTNC